jgi:hypothetical protein
MRLSSTLCSLAIASSLLTGVAGAKSKPPAAGPIVIEAPPAQSDLATDSLFDAAVAIGEAGIVYPAGALRAASLYGTALVRYRAGDTGGAQQLANQAIASSVPMPTAGALPMPQVSSSAQADAESYLALARHALSNCGKADESLNRRYTAAVQAMLAQRYPAAISDARGIVESCAVSSMGTPAPS